MGLRVSGLRRASQELYGVHIEISGVCRVSGFGVKGLEGRRVHRVTNIPL